MSDAPKLTEEESQFIEGLRKRMPADTLPAFDNHLQQLSRLAVESTIKTYLPIIMRRQERELTDIISQAGIDDPKDTADKLVETYVRLSNGPEAEAPPLAPKANPTQTQR